MKGLLKISEFLNFKKLWILTLVRFFSFPLIPQLPFALMDGRSQVSPVSVLCLRRYDRQSAVPRSSQRRPHQTGPGQRGVFQGFVEIAVSAWEHQEARVCGRWREILPSTYAGSAVCVPLRWVRAGRGCSPMCQPRKGPGMLSISSGAVCLFSF